MRNLALGNDPLADAVPSVEPPCDLPQFGRSHNGSGWSTGRSLEGRCTICAVVADVGERVLSVLLQVDNAPRQRRCSRRCSSRPCDRSRSSADRCSRGRTDHEEEPGQRTRVAAKSTAHASANNRATIRDWTLARLSESDRPASSIVTTMASEAALLRATYYGMPKGPSGEQ